MLFFGGYIQNYVWVFQYKNILMYLQNKYNFKVVIYRLDILGILIKEDFFNLYKNIVQVLCIFI